MNDLVFRTRALAQTHPLSRLATRFVSDTARRESASQPEEEFGVWAGYCLTNGYCLRKVEEVETNGAYSELVGESEHWDSGDLRDSLAEIVSQIRITGTSDIYLLDEATIIETLDRLIEGEIDRRLDPFKGDVSATTWQDLEQYLAWWVLAGYALRCTETSGAVVAVERGTPTTRT